MLNGKRKAHICLLQEFLGFGKQKAHLFLLHTHRTVNVWPSRQKKKGGSFEASKSNFHKIMQ